MTFPNRSSYTWYSDSRRPNPADSLEELGPKLTRALLATILDACIEHARQSPLVSQWQLEEAQKYAADSQAANTDAQALSWAIPVFKKCQMAVGDHLPSARDAAERELTERTQQIQLIARLAAGRK